MVNKLKILRVTKGMSQQELAKALGVTQGAVSQWETGTKQPNEKMLYRLAEVLECDFKELDACYSPEKTG